ncbi:hypothetical protein Dimus_014349 [Dionaea muscipula]
MALKKKLSHGLFSISRFTAPNPNSLRNLTKPHLTQCLIASDPVKAAMDPDRGDSGLFRRVMQWRQLYQSAIKSPAIRSLPMGDRLMDKLREMDMAKDGDRVGVRLKALRPPKEEVEGGLTAGDVKELMRVWEMEMVKAKLRETRKDWITYSEFVEVCKRSCGDEEEKGMVYARMLEDSCAVIVLENSVCLHPQQVVKAIQSLNLLQMPNLSDPRRKEFTEMEEQKKKIDRKAESLVRRELWCGLGYLVVHTAVFTRLTFWELSWDVMEPICYYVASFYLIARYAFFLRTSKEPSFEGFFQSRFASKQSRLFKTVNFNVQRYNELRKTFYLDEDFYQRKHHRCFIHL